MRSKTISLLALAGLAAALTACGPTPKPAAEKPAAPTTAPATLSPKAKASVRAAAGIPPEPTAATRAAYIAALDAIDKDVVHGKPDKAVDRGLNQCSSIKGGKDRAKLIELTNQRFSSPSHPEGHGLAKAEKILDAVHKNLCPDF
jgi:predicted small lipoprotein YifL